MTAPLQRRFARKTPVTRYGSTLAESAPLAGGHGEAHADAIEFQPGGVIGPHEPGFGHVLVLVDGTGWVTGEDRRRVPLAIDEVALSRRGDIHSKSGDHGSIALVVQVRNFDASTSARARPSDER